MLLNGYESLINLNKSMMLVLEGELESLKSSSVYSDNNMADRIKDLESRKAELQKHINEDQKIIDAYNTMKAGIMKLRELRKIVPRDTQDLNDIAYEKKRREQEIIDSRKILPYNLLNQLHEEIEVINKLEAEQEKKKAAKANKSEDNQNEPTQDEAKESDQTEPTQDEVKESDQTKPTQDEAKESDQTEPTQDDTKESDPNILISTPVSDDTKKEREPKIPYDSFISKIKQDDPKPEPSVNPEPTIKKGLMQIFGELTAGLEIKVTTGKKYTASNIKVGKQLKQDLKSGNVLYNIVHTVPAIIKAAASGFKKLCSKFAYKAKEKEDMAILEERVNNLSETDVETIYREYRGTRVLQEKMPSALNILLQKRINTYVMNKLTELNGKIEANYNVIFQSIKRVDEIDIALPSTPLDQRDVLLQEKTDILNGKADLVKETRENYVEANEFLNGGLHGFNEDMKAAATKLSYVGKRFVKEADLDLELLAEQVELEKKENTAIANGNNEAALRAFVENEVLLSDTTAIEKSIFGNRSTGKKYYSPIVSELNYNNDPFIRDLFTTVALASTVGSALSSVVTDNKIAQAVNSHNSNVTSVNQANESAMLEVNSYGQEIVDKQEVFQEGMEAQAYANNVSVGTGYERFALDNSAVVDGTRWNTSSESYKAIDEIGHTTTNDLYASTQSEIESIANQYANGALDKAGVLSSYSQVASDSYASLNNLLVEYQPLFEEYVATHPQYDLTGLSGAIDYLVKNPDAINNMNQGMVDVVEIGESLSGSAIQSLEMLGDLPNNLRSRICSYVAAASIAFSVASTMTQNAVSGKYGNSITNLVSEYSKPTEVENQEVEQAQVPELTQVDPEVIELEPTHTISRR